MIDVYLGAAIWECIREDSFTLQGVSVGLDQEYRDSHTFIAYPS